MALLCTAAQNLTTEIKSNQHTDTLMNGTYGIFFANDMVHCESVHTGNEAHVRNAPMQQCTNASPATVRFFSLLHLKAFISHPAFNLYTFSSQSHEMFFGAMKIPKTSAR